ncbi:CU044_2847 family protein [Aerosakkonema sp. BLCC-F183]|uniref:CU044_2847 family protein n=1 Tax=Aerosakkonema sp. BLCC-F183 TaxID=3342834 RepID=UPI0035B6EE00
MKRLVKFDLGNGETIMVEVDEPDTGGPKPVARNLVEDAKKSFDEALDKIKPIATKVISKVRDISDSPDEVEVKFGLKMSVESGVIMTSVGGEANYEITLKWKKQNP